MKKVPYSDKLDADQQISTEEKIAAYLYSAIELRPSGTLSPTDGDLNQAAKEILYLVLREFRPDLFEEATGECNKRLPDGG